MSLDHVVPRFFLARWASAEGVIEVFDRRSQKVSLEDPATFDRIEGFNEMVGLDGQPATWLESELLAGLDNGAARYMRQLEEIQGPPSHMRRARKENWHHGHLLGPRQTAGMSMFVAAQMVRSPVWRDAVKRDTASHIKEVVEEKVRRDLEDATTEEEKKRLQGLLGLRFMVSEVPRNLVPHLSGHLAYRIGELVYTKFSWAVHRFEEPLLALGNEPVGLLKASPERWFGSLAEVARATSAFSIHAPPADLVEKALAIVSQADRVVMPIGPRHALVLSRWEHLWPPGCYDMTAPTAAFYNRLLAFSSREWVAGTPGGPPLPIFGEGLKAARKEQPTDPGSVQAA